MALVVDKNDSRLLIDKWCSALISCIFLKTMSSGSVKLTGQWLKQCGRSAFYLATIIQHEKPKQCFKMAILPNTSGILVDIKIRLVIGIGLAPFFPLMVHQ